jgi:ADP-ribose pyrophosphatase YjhB (NUDIX family)
MEQLRLPDQTMYSDLPDIDVRDYVNILVLNEAREALVLEGYKQGNSSVCWKVLGGYLEGEEDPFTAVQRSLLQKIGYQTTHWSYLGSHGTERNRYRGVGHFFCAQQASPVANVQNDKPDTAQIKWVQLTDLRYALQDGRIPIMSHALTISLALLTVLK